MNNEKQLRVDQVEQAMCRAFTAGRPLDFNLDAWAEKVMADVRRQTFDETDNLKIIGRAAWFALAASLLLAGLVYFMNNDENSFKSYDLLTGEQVSIESAYRN